MPGHPGLKSLFFNNPLPAEALRHLSQGDGGSLSPRSPFGFPEVMGITLDTPRTDPTSSGECVVCEDLLQRWCEYPEYALMRTVASVFRGWAQLNLAKVVHNWRSEVEKQELRGELARAQKRAEAAEQAADTALALIGDLDDELTNQAGQDKVEQCASCGNIFKDDSVYCRKRSRPRDGQQTGKTLESKCCECGNEFCEDSLFCRKCSAPRPKDAFISHVQNETADYAVDAYHSFHGKGKRAWLDVKMDHCDEKAMEEGVKHAKVVLVIASEGYFKSGFCMKELGWAVQYNKPIVVAIPVELKTRIGELLGTCPPEFRLISSINFITLMRGDNAYWNLGVNKLLKAMETAKTLKQLAKEAAAARDIQQLAADNY